MVKNDQTSSRKGRSLILLFVVYRMQSFLTLTVTYELGSEVNRILLQIGHQASGLYGHDL